MLVAFLWAKMASVDGNSLVSAPLQEVDDDARAAAVARLRDLFSGGELSLERFDCLLGQLLTAASHAELESAILALPPLVRLTPASQRLGRPLVLRAPDGALQMGAGWQLAADTTVSTGCGKARLDLTAASWDVSEISLRLQTWGSIEVLIPKGVLLQVLGGSATVRLESLSVPVPGGPILRISTSGPAGVIRVGHPKERNGGLLARWMRPGSRGRASLKRSDIRDLVHRGRSR